MKKNRSYRKGYRFEREVAKHLEKRGFFVIRQGKSRFPDLVAIGRSLIKGCTTVFFIECKYNKRPDREEIEKLYDLRDRYNAHVRIAYKKKGQKGFKFYHPEEFEK